jgi:hypothetical protein
MNLFSTRDEAYHRAQKRPVANAYSLTSLLVKEDAIDSCSTLFMYKLGQFADQKRSIDLGAWLQYYAFDVVGELSFAKKLGFIEKGEDVDGMMEAIEGMLVNTTYTSVVENSSLTALSRSMPANAARSPRCINFSWVTRYFRSSCRPWRHGTKCSILR